MTDYELWDESDGHQFHQYQQNEQSPLILTELTEHNKTTTNDVGTDTIFHMSTKVLTNCRGIRHGVHSAWLLGYRLYVDFIPNNCRAHFNP